MNEINQLRAYILGWLACDGCLEANGVTVSLQIQKRDSKVLELFKRAFGARIDNTSRFIKGREYVRARVHDSQFWSGCKGMFGGRLKPEKSFPVGATVPFVIGCFDADGCFAYHSKYRYIQAQFYHSSKAFIAGLQTWLSQHGIKSANVPAKTCERIEISNRGCVKLAEFYQQVPWALQRKASIAGDPPPRASVYWTPEQVELLRNWKAPITDQLIKRIGRTAKAVRLKSFYLKHGKRNPK